MKARKKTIYFTHDIYFTHVKIRSLFLKFPSIFTVLKSTLQSLVRNWITNNIDKDEIKIRKLQQSKHAVDKVDTRIGV